MWKPYKKGYRLPEHWSEFRGKLSVIKPIVEAYQEVKDFADSIPADQLLDFVLVRIKNEALSMPYGDVVEQEGAKATFDVLRHEGKDIKMGETVTVVAPGFRCQDPAGREIIVAKAIARKL